MLNGQKYFTGVTKYFVIGCKVFSMEPIQHYQEQEPMTKQTLDTGESLLLLLIYNYSIRLILMI